MAELERPCERTVAMTNAIREGFSLGDGKLRDAFTFCIRGYITWHLSLKRYYLERIDLRL